MKLYVREWRKFMGVAAPVVAQALDIERESYLKMERETWRISAGEAFVIAKEIGVSVTQLRFPPPPAGAERPLSLDELVEDQSEDFKRLAAAAIRGMASQR
jgi:hypothetical protein